MAGMSSEAGEWHICGFTFISNFDSGNLGHVQLVHKDGIPETGSTVQQEPVRSGHQPRPSTSAVSRPAILDTPHLRPSTSSVPRSAGGDNSDVAFNLWTKPDCAGTEFENGNRTWFYFGLMGGPPGAVVKFTMMNLNKQSKLFSQGMIPVFMLTPGKHQWERLRDKPTYRTEENNFSMSFRFRNLEDTTNIVYFAFTYPYTYKELQTSLVKLDKKFGNRGASYEDLSARPDHSIYFHKETVIRSLEHRKLTLITISGMSGIQPEKESDLEHLFEEEEDNRPYTFSGKKTIFVSARVHPGETCSSFVMNGLLKFLLRESDPRAIALRRKYVFKLIPMLNPDGVYKGHYRTDSRGVNLNRVYGKPSRLLHPTIYAARKLILLAHCGYEVKEDDNENNNGVGEESKEEEDDPKEEKTEDYDSFVGAAPLNEHENWYKPLSLWDIQHQKPRTSTSSRVSNSSRASNTSSHISPVKQDLSVNWYEMTETSRFSEGDESIADFSVPSFGIGSLIGNCPISEKAEDDQNGTFSFQPPDTASSCSSSRRDSLITARTTFTGAFNGSVVADASVSHPTSTPLKESISEPDLPSRIDRLESNVPTYFGPNGESGLFLYVDIHGHASKRGIFMYGNHFEEQEARVESMLFPKLMSINSANFDFPACNFTQRNMFMKDRHTGAGREGCGRVSVYRATGLVNCFTLECNFNTGRDTNTVPAASRDGGRASPAPFFDTPPKYSPGIYEDTGKAMAISLLDLTESNPWTRLTCSDCKNMRGVRSWIRHYLKSSEAQAKKKTASSKSGNKLLSPMRTRLRSLGSNVRKTTPTKSLKLPLKSPSSPEITRPLSKVPRKALSPKYTQSSTTKPSLQRSHSRNSKNSAKIVDLTTKSTSKKKRLGSATMKKSRSGSKPSSRPASPHNNKTKIEPKVTKIGLQKKVLQKTTSWTPLDEVQPCTSTVSQTGKKVKRRKTKTASKITSN